MNRFFYRFMNDESGIGVVELILVLVVLIGLVVIFRDQLTSLMNSIFERIIQDSNAV
ncbi:MAG: hypothetical protein J5518_03320 [Lachnospiraceae bacterium]|nr:hypothetical protein [Lachnospiraceae bacterium]